MKTLRNMTDVQRAAFATLERLYQNDLNVAELGWSMPPSHVQLCHALRMLDRVVGFDYEADDTAGAPGLGCRAWTIEHRAECAPLSADVVLSGSLLADRMLADAAWACSGTTPDQIVYNELARLLGPLAEATTEGAR